MHATTILIATLGVGALTAMTFGPGPQSRQLAIVIPPWSDPGPAFAAAAGLAILDMRWSGHVLILDTGGDPAVLARLRARGLWLLDAGRTGLCRTEPEGA